MNEVITTVENILYPLITVLGLVTNAFVIAVIIVSEKSRRNRTVANTFVLNLAIADILFLIVLPFYTPSLHVNGYPYTAGACKFLEGMKHVNYHASILFLTGMSIDRYIAIVHSLQSLEYRSQHNARILCAVIWIISFVVSSPILAFSYLETWDSNSTSVAYCTQMFPGYTPRFVPPRELYEEHGSALYEYYDENEYYNGSSYMNESYYSPEENETMPPGGDNETKTCDAGIHKNSTSFRAWQWITFIAFFLLPVLVVMFCYFKIWRATAVREVKTQRADEIQAKITVMVACLISAFIICWMPFQTWILLTLYERVRVLYAEECDIINVTVILLAWTNSVLNPILYSITSENFRKRAVTTIFYMRYGYRRTMQMSTTRNSRAGVGMRSDKTGITTLSHAAPSPKLSARLELQQMTPPRTPRSARF